MVLESDPIYDAMQLLSEKGYTIIETNFMNTVIAVSIAVCLFVGFLIGFHEWKTLRGIKERLKVNK